MIKRRWQKLLLDSLLIAIFAIVLLELVLHVASFVLSRPQVKSAINSSPHTRILCLGDSHTYGLFLNREQAWPAVLEKQLREQGYSGVEVVNLAYPGTNSYRVRHSIESMMEDVRPDYVILMLGANDYWTTPLDVANNTEGALGHFVRKYSRIYKLIMFIMKTGEAKTEYYLEDTLRNVHEEQEEEAMENIRKALEFYKIEVVDGVDGVAYAVSQDKKISLKDIVAGIKSGQSEKQILPDLQEVTDTGFLNLVILEDLLKKHLQLNSKALGNSGKLVAYGENEYRLGPSFGEGGEQVNGKKASEDLAGNLAYIASIVKASNAEPLLMTYHFQVKYVYANDVIRKVAAEKQIPLIDLHHAILEVCKPFVCPQLLFSDLHPNEHGQVFIADKVGAFLQKNILNQAVNNN